MGAHIHSLSAKSDAFSFQSQALFNGVVSAEFNRSASSDDAMPGQIEATAQRRYYLSSRTLVPRSLRNRPVRGHVSSGNGTNGLQNVVAHVGACLPSYLIL